MIYCQQAGVVKILGRLVTAKITQTRTAVIAVLTVQTLPKVQQEDPTCLVIF